MSFALFYKWLCLSFFTLCYANKPSPDPLQKGSQIVYSFHSDAHCLSATTYKVEIDNTTSIQLNQCTKEKGSSSNFVRYECRRSPDDVSPDEATFTISKLVYSNQDCMSTPITNEVLSEGPVCRRASQSVFDEPKPDGGFLRVHCKPMSEVINLNRFTHVSRTLYPRDGTCGQRHGNEGIQTITILDKCAPVYDPDDPYHPVTHYRKVIWTRGIRSTEEELDTATYVTETLHNAPDKTCETPPFEVLDRYYPSGYVDPKAAPHCLRDAVTDTSYYVLRPYSVLLSHKATDPM